MTDTIKEHILAIKPGNLGTILHCTGRGFGESRNIAGITATAEEWNASVAVVAAAFGFVRDQYRPGAWCDLLCPEHNRPAAAPIIDTNSELRAALYLACCVFGGQLMMPYDLAEIRLKQRIRYV
jgi:hypothetical protein